MRALHAHTKVNKCCREASHELIENQLSNSIKTCQKPVKNLLDDHFILGIVTCDDKWLCINNRDKQEEWLNRGGQLTEMVANRYRFSQMA